ncbi:hypothetical protein Dimus_018189 [Dionaea muscipula]
MSMPIRSHLKRMKSVGHGPMGAKRRKLLTYAPKESQVPKDPQRIKPTSPEVLKSTSLSSQHDEEDLDAFWNTLTRVDGTSGSTTVGLSLEVRQEEVVQLQETIQIKAAETSFILLTQEEHQSSQLLSETVSEVDKGKAPVEVDPACLTGVSASAAQTSTSTPSHPKGLYPRDNEILLSTDPRRLRGAMMVNLVEVDGFKTTISALFVEVEEEKRKREEAEKKVKERKKWEADLKEEEKQKRKEPHDEIAQQLKRVQELDRSTCQQLQEDILDLRRELQGKIDAESRATRELSQVQSARNNVEQMVTQQSETIKELKAINQKLKERLDDGKKKRKTLVGVLNEYEERAKVKDLMQRAGQNLSILKGLNIGREISFPTEPYVQYPEEFLPSHSSNARLPNPFKFLKDWIEEEEKKDQPESSRRSGRRK